ncbi:hydrophobic surface binding protein A-domain-containing protein [Aspergillus pseudotamarii]|uniref:Hydrophobic surface binding protein A-domain-containing protein n=1 Tax=Aspergillus pseudotamarii TaxID=132259 RepID=A0A5N6T6M5_ASPPS|nr:hydrophobic surface binding protein A-domain-containing protein [Aspergillus pseudotamarii]KAE8141906.1 hydrophobic surface binding protein A-domain-containing protein [Aspergillus pseudotamarii]
MKLSVFSILTLGLTAGALATPANIQRDLPTITGVLSGIGTKVDALDSAIQAYTGGDVAKVQQASDSLVDAINAGTTKVSGSSNLSGGDALGLPGPVNNLKQKITTAVTHLSGKKSQIVQAGKGGQTYNDLIQQKTAAKKLSDTIVSKVPENLQNLASGIAGGISDAIEKGVQDFQDQATKGGKREVASADAVAAIAV